jgi:hypothetical protein
MPRSETCPVDFTSLRGHQGGAAGYLQQVLHHCNYSLLPTLYEVSDVLLTAGTLLSKNAQMHSI